MRRAGAIALLVLAGCAPQAFIASPWDYAGYRATRVAPTLEERLAAAHRYLEERPDGRFKDEVRAFFDPAEEAFFAANKGSKEGLRAYLRALPRGPHREQATRRIGEIETAERSSRAEMERSSAEVTARVSGRAARERAQVREEIQAWARRFLDRAAFDVPLAAASADLVVPFSLSLPSPRCTLLEVPVDSPRSPLRGHPPRGAVARRCVKLLELPYSVEGERGAEARQATIEVTVAQDARGVPLEAVIGGPDLFVRLEETHRVKPVEASDTAQRAAAISRAVELVKAAFVERVSADPACRRRPSPPAVLDLACGGVSVTVTAAAAAGEDDRVVIGPFQP